ncbi:CTD small phosphatase-like protein 2 [Lolium rigidum]|uniref:CTD small phosphatase-like protein 2 n=1 Tax=Lolium rigidum TaxID=89674 RepID=UPI001F5D88FE|nr:CTD small phosphatase-like protein 2 [Lolium rigidum]
MTSNFSDDAVRRELGEYSNGGNSMAHQLNSPVRELPRSQVNADPHTATSMTAQIACEDTEMVYEDLGDEESWALVKHLSGHLPQLTDVPILPPKKNITLVLDIDGTLIHSSMRDEGADFSFILLRGTEESTVYVKKRPYVDAFLKKVAEMFDIVVFTASISSYADQLLDILDPGRLISRRYYRDSCLSLGGKYLKDLTIIEANLMKVAIIDNTPEVFRLQVNNGIPINTWSSDPYDTSLLELIPFLETLSVAKDVRPLIANKFASYT